ncbi:MAG: chemotaxis protein CheA [Nitrospirae bacterium]|nr:chemotaxis protein CheA [Nitrospirota bacterium]
MATKKQDMLLKDFMIEAEEIIETVDQSLFSMDAEKRSESGISPNTIHSLFRAIHTLKGTAGMVGLIPVSNLSHRMEDLLDKLRLGKLEFDDSLFDLLTEASDMLRNMLQNYSSPGKKTIDPQPMIQRIDDRLLNKTDSGGKDPLRGGISPDILKTFTEYETFRLQDNQKKGLGIYEMRVHYKLETFDLELVKTLDQIKPYGEVITSLPVTGLSPDAGIMFKIIVASKENLPQLEVEWVGEKIEFSRIGGLPTRTASDSGPANAASFGGASQDENSETVKSVTQTVRVDITKLDALMNIVGELVLNKSVIQQLGRSLMEKNSYSDLNLDFQKALESISRKISELQDNLVQVRMTPVGQIFDRLVRMVRKISRELDKPVNVHISGEETSLDKSMIEAIADPLMHLIRNAIDHGLESKEERLAAGKTESGNLNLRATQKGNNVLIEVEDDGQGIELQAVYQKAIEKNLADPKKEYSPKDLINFIFLPGFSTSKAVTDLSGRGVGLDVVAKNIAKLSGMVNVETDPGRGSKFSITLPITLIIIRALIVEIGQETYAIPLNSVSESLIVAKSDVKSIDQRDVIQLRDQTLPLVRLEELYQKSLSIRREDSIYVIVVGSAEKRIGLIVDDVIGQQEIVIKSLGNILGTLPGIAGACELGNRKTILVLDVAMLIEEVLKKKAVHG